MYSGKQSINLKVNTHKLLTSFRNFPHLEYQHASYSRMDVCYYTMDTYQRSVLNRLIIGSTQYPVLSHDEESEVKVGFGHFGGTRIR